jgi:hypothetical protein
MPHEYTNSRVVWNVVIFVIIIVFVVFLYARPNINVKIEAQTLVLSDEDANKLFSPEMKKEGMLSAFNWTGIDSHRHEYAVPRSV